MRVKEGRLSMNRKEFEDGFIDFYTSDIMDDPNKKVSPRLNLNSFGSWMRLNGEGEWIPIRKGHHPHIDSYSKVLDAWNFMKDM